MDRQAVGHESGNLAQQHSEKKAAGSVLALPKKLVGIYGTEKSFLF